MKTGTSPSRVVHEFSNNQSSMNFSSFDDSHKQKEQQTDNRDIRDNINEEEGDDDEFEFALVSQDHHQYISADDIFLNGQIKPFYPLHDHTLILKHEKPTELTTKTSELPFQRLFIEDTGSSASSEAEDLDGVPTGSYCVWRPKGVDDQQLIEKSCKKSNSTGTNNYKKWRLRDLLYRSNSDGKDHHSLTFLTPKSKQRAAVKSSAGSGGDKGRVVKRQSYLPYKVGLFSNVDGLSKNLHSF